MTLSEESAAVLTGPDAAGWYRGTALGHRVAATIATVPGAGPLLHVEVHGVLPIVAMPSAGTAGGHYTGDVRFDSMVHLDGDVVLTLSAWTAEARERYVALKALKPVFGDGVLWSELPGPPTESELRARAIHLAALAAATTNGRSALNPRLPERFRGETHPGVRLRLLEVLLDHRPKHEPKEAVCREALADSDARVRLRARQWLIEQGLLSEHDAPTVPPASRRVTPDVVRVAGAPASPTGPTAVGVLLSRLQDPDPEPAVQALVRFVADPSGNADDRATALRALVARGRSEAGLAVIRAADSWYPPLFVAALRALIAWNPAGIHRVAGRAVDPDGRAWLLQERVDGMPLAAELASALALAPPDPRAEAALCALLPTGVDDVVRRAIRALGAVGSESSVTALQGLAGDDAPGWRTREVADAVRAIRARLAGGPSLGAPPRRSTTPRSRTRS